MAGKVLMPKPGLDRPGRKTLSRRQALELAGSATIFTFWQRKAHGLPAPEQYVDRLAAERIADRDPEHRPILIDAQTHVWWRSGGIRQMSERGAHFLKSLAGSRASVVGHPVPIADMGRVMFVEDVFLGSETDIAFLNSFGMPRGVRRSGSLSHRARRRSFVRWRRRASACSGLWTRPTGPRLSSR
jgi:hypothetical protein